MTWDCGLGMVQASHSSGTRFCEWPKGRHGQRPRWSWLLHPASEERERPSLCALLVKAVRGQSRFEGRDFATPLGSRAACEYREERTGHASLETTYHSPVGGLSHPGSLLPQAEVALGEGRSAQTTPHGIPTKRPPCPSQPKTLPFRSVSADCPVLQMAHNKPQMQCKLIAE